jgi:tryptophan 2,3-dioxygenase
VDRLIEGSHATFFPELWEIRSHMTDAWGGQYGVVRDSLSAH